MKKTEYPSPEEFNALFVKACEDHQNQNYEAARARYEKLMYYFPEVPVLHYNFGLLLYECQAFDTALQSFQRAAELQPADNDIIFNLALCCKQTGDIEAAIKYYLEVLETEPESVDALYNTAGCFRELKYMAEAEHLYLKVLELEPDHFSANNNIAYVYHLLGEIDKAILYFKKVLELRPDHKAAEHMVAALTGAEVAAPPQVYVKEVFDNYSEFYEKSLVEELQYTVPESIYEIVKKGTSWKKQFDCGLDLGCGTGLSGESFTGLVEKLSGVDLSPKMIEIAREKGIYHSLVAGDVNEFLYGTTKNYDFFLAADVFIYLGELEETFRLLRQRASADALFCFSTESEPGNGFSLRLTGRFAHSPSYIERIARDTGWKILEKHTSGIRREKDAWIEGDLWFLQLREA
jgi:predicted TPR repeat methyltransferase